MIEKTKTILFLFYTALILSMGACQEKPFERATFEPIVDPDAAKIFLIREKSINFLDLYISIDGNYIDAKLHQSEYIEIPIEPGKHEIVVTRPALWEVVTPIFSLGQGCIVCQDAQHYELELIAEPGVSYFFGIKGGIPWGPDDRFFEIIQLKAPRDLFTLEDKTRIPFRSE